MVKRLAGGIALTAFLLAAQAHADLPTTAVIGTPPQPTWSKLTLDQRVVLAPLATEWDNLENVRRKKWLVIAERYPSLNPDEQRRVHDRMREWALLTPEQRGKVRDSYKEFNQLPAEQKKAVKQKWETYSSLTEEERAQVRKERERPKSQTPESPASSEPAAPAPAKP